MIKFVGKLPYRPAIAVSGGPDSMAVLDFLKWKNPLVLYFNHGTSHGKDAEIFVRDYCEKENLELSVGFINRDKQSNESPEEYWRNCRYDFLFSNNKDLPIITGHNLDDQVEQWIFSSFHGNPFLIPYRRGVLIRPFIITKKVDFVGWCKDRGVPYLVDPSNSSEKYMRSYIRNEVVSKALFVNPGIYKVVKKKILNKKEWLS